MLATRNAFQFREILPPRNESRYVASLVLDPSFTGGCFNEADDAKKAGVCLHNATGFGKTFGPTHLNAGRTVFSDN